MNPPAALAMRAVRRAFDRRPVLRHVDLAIRPGEVAVLVGGSGSGKTTLLRIAAGLERADAGIVERLGRIVEGDPAGRRHVPPEQRGLGMVFQDHALWPHLSALENVALAVPAGTGARRGVAAGLLEAVGLDGATVCRRPSGLSGGQCQRVALARALATGSDLLLLDEPLSSLDEAVRERLRTLIRDRLRDRRCAALFVSHDRLDAWRLADRILMLEDGVISQSGRPAELHAAPATLAVARIMGAEGRLAVRHAGGARFITGDGHHLRALRSDLPTGTPAVATAWPQAVRLASGGLPARLLDCGFEAGGWRARWMVAGGELVGFHQAPPPEHAALAVDPNGLHVFAQTAAGDENPS